MKMFGVLIALMLFTVSFSQVAPIAPPSNSDILQSINTIGFTWSTRLDSIEARQSAVQRDVFNVRNDTLLSVNDALDRFDAVQTAKLDAIEMRMQNRIDIMEREKWFILVGSIAATAVVVAFMVMPFLRHLGILLRTDKQPKPELPDKTYFENIKQVPYEQPAPVNKQTTLHAPFKEPKPVPLEDIDFGVNGAQPRRNGRFAKRV